MEIIKRKLTNSEIHTIYKEIKKTPNITGHTVEELKSYDNVYLAIDNDELLGLGVWIEISKKWNELLILFVLNKYRNKEIGKSIFNKLLSEMKSNNKNIFISSRNSIVEKWMNDNKFRIINFSKLPIEIKFYYLRYSFSLYRIKEFIRKNFLKKNRPFVYGLFYPNKIIQ